MRLLKCETHFVVCVHAVLKKKIICQLLNRQPSRKVSDVCDSLRPSTDGICISSDS